MKGVVFVILLCVLSLCKSESECVKEYSQEEASAAEKAG